MDFFAVFKPDPETIAETDLKLKNPTDLPYTFFQGV
jgi:hypothetical protein